MDDIILIITIVLAAISAVSLTLMIMLLIKFRKIKMSEIKDSLEKMTEDELSKQRIELNNRIDNLSFNTQKSINDGLTNINDGQVKGQRELYTHINETLNMFSETNRKTISELRLSQDEKLEYMRKTTEEKLDTIGKTNKEALEKIEETVSEKLEKTLSERVTESFKNVSFQLESVQKGLGEMTQLANQVGDLKKTLSSVKLRGEFGETQLSRILEQLLTPEQYEENVITVPGSHDPVEFAVKIPSKNDDKSFIYLPIDAKFPMDLYNKLIDSYDQDDKNELNNAKKELFDRIKREAKDISSKYISPPNTTDFAILFLPTEGLFAEVIRDAVLTEQLRNDFKVTVCGPSTITAFLNSLQMGFRTLEIEKSSSKVWNILSNVRTEFAKFENTLKKVQKNLDSSQKELDELVGARTRKINSSLRGLNDNVFGLPANDTAVDDDEE